MERNDMNYVTQPQIEGAYARYDADPRASGPDDYEAFKAAVMAEVGMSARPEDGYTGRFPFIDSAPSLIEDEGK